MIDAGTLLIAILGGAASGLVAWGAMRTEIKFLWRDLRRLEVSHKAHGQRLDVVERRRAVRAVTQ